MTLFEFFACLLGAAGLGLGAEAWLRAGRAIELGRRVEESTDAIADLIDGHWDSESDEEVPWLSERVDDAELRIDAATACCDGNCRRLDRSESKVDAAFLLAQHAKRRTKEIGRTLTESYGDLKRHCLANADRVDKLESQAKRVAEAMVDPEAPTETDIQPPASIFPDAMGDSIASSLFKPIAPGEMVPTPYVWLRVDQLTDEQRRWVESTIPTMAMDGSVLVAAIDNRYASNDGLEMTAACPAAPSILVEGCECGCNDRTPVRVKVDTGSSEFHGTVVEAGDQVGQSAYAMPAPMLKFATEGVDG